MSGELPMPYLDSVNATTYNHTTLLTAHTVVTFFLGLFSIFQPVYFYQMGVPVSWIVGYEVGYWIFSFLMVLPNYYLVSKIGLKTSLILAWIFRIMLFGILASLSFLIEQYSLLMVLMLIGLLYRLAAGYYWFPFHSIFSVVTDGEHEGRSLGYRIALNRLTAIIAPIVGGFLLFTLPAHWFFIIICAGFTVGLFLYRFVTIPPHTDTHIKAKEIYNECMRRENFSYYTEGIIGRTQEFVWPLLLGLREVTLIVLGSLFTFANLVRTGISVVIGNSLDGHKNWVRLIQGVGMGIMSISFLMRSFFFGIVFAGIGQAIGGIGQTVYNTPTLASMYQKANPSSFITPIATRELLLNLGRTSLSILVFILVMFYEDIIGLTVTLFLAATWCAILSIVYSFRRS